MTDTERYLIKMKIARIHPEISKPYGRTKTKENIYFHVPITTGIIFALNRLAKVVKEINTTSWNNFHFIYKFWRFGCKTQRYKFERLLI